MFSIQQVNNESEGASTWISLSMPQPINFQLHPHGFLAEILTLIIVPQILSRSIHINEQFFFTNILLNNNWLYYK